MDHPERRTNPNINSRLTHITEEKHLTTEQKQYHIQQLNQQCKLGHNRMEFPGETLTNPLPIINHKDEPYVTYIERTIICEKANTKDKTLTIVTSYKYSTPKKTQIRNNRSARSKRPKFLRASNVTNVPKEKPPRYNDAAR